MYRKIKKFLRSGCYDDGAFYFLTQKNMRSLNRTMLVGHLAADVEIRKSEKGVAVATFPVATNRDWLASDGTKMQAVDYHKVVAFRKLAEICSRYLVKGTPICIEGRLQNSVFEKKDGKKGYITEIVLDQLYLFIYKKKGNEVEVGVKEVGAEENESTEKESVDKESADKVVEGELVAV